MINAVLTNSLLSAFAIALNLWLKSYLAGIVDKEELALFYTAIDLTSLFLLFFMGTRSAMVVSYSKTKDDKEILNIVRFAILTVVTISIFIAFPILDYYITLPLPAYIMSLLLIAFSINIYQINQLGMYRLYKAMNQLTIYEPLLTIIIFLSFFILLSFEPLDALIISTISTYLVISFYILHLKKDNHPEPKVSKVIFSKDIKRFIKNAFLSSLEFILGMAAPYMAILFLITYFTLQDLGDFQVVVKSFYFYFLTLFVFPIFKFALPELSKLLANKEYEEINKIEKWIWGYSSLIAVVLFILTSTFGTKVVFSLFGENYFGAIQMLEIMSLSLLFVLLGAFYSSLLKSLNKFFYSMSIRGLGIITFFITFFTMKNGYGVDSILYGFVASHIVTGILFTIIARQKLSRV